MLPTKLELTERVFVNSADREKLISEQVALIKLHASRLRVQLPAGIGIEALVSAGVGGLIAAAASYQSDSGFEFKSRADQHIQAAMAGRLRELNSRPCQISSITWRLGKSSQEPDSESSTAAKDLELCHALRITPDQLPTFVFNTQLDGFSLGKFSSVSNKADQSEPGKRFLSFHAGCDSEPCWALEETEVQKLITAGVEDLPPKERLVVSLHYLEELTMKEIATILRTPEWKVLQLHTKAMLRLQTRLISH
jgi:RNA polymerase sigma factor for flagellar operon FliA